MKRSHDHEDFTKATLPCLDLVYNLARRFTQDRYVVEDLVQETYTKAFEAWVDGRKPRDIKPWIATVCLNVGRSHLRRASTRRERPTDKFLEMTDRTDVEAEAITNVDAAAARSALWDLPEEQRIAITLMDLDGFTARETARIMGTPRGTVLSRVHRGRKSLASALEGRVSDHEKA